MSLTPADRAALKRLVDERKRRRTPQPTLPPAALTRRERQVLQAAAEGCQIKDTAERLGTAYNTVAKQRKSAMRKLGARTITHAVVLAGRERGAA